MNRDYQLGLLFSWPAPGSSASATNCPKNGAVDGKPSRSGRPGEQRQETGGPGRAGRGEVCGAFPPGRARHQCGVCGRFGAVDYESDQASVGSDGTAVYPGWKPVSGEQHGQAGAVVPSAQCASFERITSEPDRLFFAGLELFAGEGLPPRLNYRKKPKPDQGAREWSAVGWCGSPHLESSRDSV